VAKFSDKVSEESVLILETDRLTEIPYNTVEESIHVKTQLDVTSRFDTIYTGLCIIDELTDDDSIYRTVKNLKVGYKRSLQEGANLFFYAQFAIVCVIPFLPSVLYFAHYSRPFSFPDFVSYVLYLSSLSYL